MAAERLSRAGLERARDDDAAELCLFPLSVAALASGAYEEVVQHCLRTGKPLQRQDGYGIAALATTYAGRPEEAHDLNEQGYAYGVSPTMRAVGDYTAGEIDSALGQVEIAERHYLGAIDLARSSGATFMVGVANVGLLANRARAGRTHDALRGYREVIDYFARTGNWTHLWVTLRNLADLLRRIGDDEPAALLEAAADQAPDAPAVPGTNRDPRPRHR